MELQISKEMKGNTAVISVQGEVDMYNAPGLKEKVLAVMEQEGLKMMVLDLREVDYIDSTGLGILIGFRRRMIEGGGEMRVVIRSKRMKRLFEVTGLAKVFGVYESLESATADISGGG